MAGTLVLACAFGLAVSAAEVPGGERGRKGEEMGEVIGGIERLDPRADEVVATTAVVERLTADRFGWSEGPVWVASRGQLLFSDVPGNTLYGWSEPRGVEVVLSPSGLEGEVPDSISEAGSNGLIADGPDAVVMGDSGNRAISRVDLRTGERTFLTSAFEGRRYNSPNDLVRSADGAIYFSDPPYGLEGGDASPIKEAKVNGVYRLSPGGEVVRIEDELGRPNGVALSPDGTTLYVAHSDPEAARLYAYALGDDGLPTARRVLLDLTDMVRAGEDGLPDGMAVHSSGKIFLGGPGGIHLVSPEGERLALIRTGTVAANVALTDDEETLFVTSGKFLARVRLTGD